MDQGPGAARDRALSAGLPDFPWDSLADLKAQAQAHPDGVVDLSVGTPVDPVPDQIRAALASVSDRAGYPTTHGTPELREAAVAALRRRFEVEGVFEKDVLPTIGSKELVAWLPTLLGVGAGSLVVIPELAYPTYEVGALLAGATVVRSDGLTALGPQNPAIIWLNSPSNPTGRVLPVPHLRKVVSWARERGAIVLSDECYMSLGWETTPVSVLHPSVNEGSMTGILAVHSLSKSSSLAGYRAGFVTGDPALVASLLEVRKHAGMMVPRPVQEAMTVALSDDSHVESQKSRYRARRTILRGALESAGFTIDHSEAGLYLWSTRGEDAWKTLSWLAERGILVAPGTFYGPTGSEHVRVALTATDERIQAAATRLSS
ncbi:succinyldiaminopimelate transaminase [Kibdelosporangium philippinense]|uniref:Aminotransferase n=1 Tax=Kibdelosporangium philippinense TaxID=211113 RepID=A0ABS8ZL25_9PSEU|nr:succinyldiaminopimelate transaminase [Kibdelosporangium philippinense]MCE7008494.1 succinyldiaminopimelate transaminase [Kibdelosporangium philippinense]